MIRAGLSVGVDGDELIVHFGGTRLEIWSNTRQAPPVDQLKRFLAAIFAGDFVEAGSRKNGFARIRLDDGSVATVGEMHLPVPWRLRRTRRYDPYGTP